MLTLNKNSDMQSAIELAEMMAAQEHAKTSDNPIVTKPLDPSLIKYNVADKKVTNDNVTSTKKTNVINQGW
jgi:hypothetical protein